MVEDAAKRAFLACGLAEQPLALLTAHAGLQLVDRAAQPVERRTRAMADERDPPGGSRQTYAVDRAADVRAQSLEARQVAWGIRTPRFGVGERQGAEDLTIGSNRHHDGRARRKAAVDLDDTSLFVIEPPLLGRNLPAELRAARAYGTRDRADGIVAGDSIDAAQGAQETLSVAGDVRSRGTTEVAALEEKNQTEIGKPRDGMLRNPFDYALRVSVTVTNTGAREGAEVVQLYLRDEVASVTPPVRALAAFRRVVLKPGEAQTTAFVLTPKQLGFYDRDMRFRVEPGRFRVFVGPSSVEGIEGTFEVRSAR